MSVFDATKYLVWDGAHAEKGGTCNSEAFAQGQASPGKARGVPEEYKGFSSDEKACSSTTPCGKVEEDKDIGGLLTKVSEYFAPSLEYCQIQVKLTNVKEIGCLVLRVMEKESSKLVYCEALDQQQILRLPEAPEAIQKEEPPKPPEKDSERLLASKVGSPYLVQVWISKSEGGAKLDQAEPGESDGDGGEDPKKLPDASEASNRVQIDCKISFEHMSWLDVYRMISESPDDNGETCPSDADKKVMWIKYKLNELGFAAGPINDDDTNEDFKKALMRYRVAHGIEYTEDEPPEEEPQKDDTEPEKDDEDGDDDMMATPQIDGEGSDEDSDDEQEPPSLPEAEPSKKRAMHRVYREDFGVDEDNLGKFPPGLDALTDHEGALSNTGKLVAAIEKEVKTGPGPLAKVFDSEGDLLDEQKQVKLFIDATRYYLDPVEYKEEFGTDREDLEKTDCEGKWMSHPWVPFRAKVTFRRRDSNAYVPIPGPVEVRWSWSEDASDHSKLPHKDNAEAWIDKATTGGSSAKGTIKSVYSGVKDDAAYSRTKEYVEKAFQEVAKKFPSELYPHNAREVFGGLIGTDDDKNSWCVFRKLEKGSGGGKEFGGGETIACSSPKPGYVKTRILAPEKDTCVYLRTSRMGGDRYRVAAEAGGVSVRTAAMTIWRRVRVSAVVCWTDTVKDFLENDFELNNTWDHVREEYAHAFVELSPLNKWNSVEDLGYAKRFTAAVDAYRGSPDVSEEDRKALAQYETQQKVVPFDATKVLSKKVHPFDPPPKIDEIVNTLLGGSGLLNTYIRGAGENPKKPDPIEPLHRDWMSSREDPDPSDDDSGFESYKAQRLGDDDRPSTLNLKDLRRQFNASKDSYRKYRLALNDFSMRKNKYDQDLGRWRQKQLKKERGVYGLSMFSKLYAACAEMETSGDEVKIWIKKAAIHYKKFVEEDGADQCAGVTKYTGQAIAIPSQDNFDDYCKYVEEKYYGAVHAIAAVAYDQLEPGGAYFLFKEVVEAHKRSRKWVADVPNAYKEELLRIIHGSEIWKTLSDWYKSGTTLGNMRSWLCKKTIKEFRDEWMDTFSKHKDYNETRHKKKLCEDDPYEGKKCPKVDGSKAVLQNQAFDKLRGLLFTFAPNFLRSHCGQLREVVHAPPENVKLNEPYSDGLIVVYNKTLEPYEFGTQLSGTRIPNEYGMGVSIGCHGGVAWVSKKCHYTPYAVIAHEIGHTIFVKHWMNAGGTTDQLSHDHGDFNCIMSYPYLKLPTFDSLEPKTGEEEFIAKLKSAYTKEKYDNAKKGKGGDYRVWMKHVLPMYYTSHFCGKCNLLLRGWNVWKEKTCLPLSSRDTGHIENDPRAKPDDM